MGMNFYALNTHCKLCGQKLSGKTGVIQKTHLGKSSRGWKFALAYNGGKYYTSWAEMKDWLENKQIINEYGENVSLEEFIDWVEDRQTLIDPVEDDGAINIYGYKFIDGEFS